MVLPNCGKFNINKITAEGIKFDYIVAQEEPKFVENMGYISCNEQNKYSSAKTR